METLQISKWQAVYESTPYKKSVHRRAVYEWIR